MKVSLLLVIIVTAVISCKKVNGDNAGCFKGRLEDVTSC